MSNRRFEMPEATEDAVFLIATSWQALGRASHGDERTMTCNCTVVLVFAAFFIEANLTHIINEMGDSREMKVFVGRGGLYPKLGWFYNKFVKDRKVTSKDDLFKDDFRRELFERFPGLEEIKRFRNGVAHGEIDKSLANRDDAKTLRDQAKVIVTDLFEIAEGEGHQIERVMTYERVISSDPDLEES